MGSALPQGHGGFRKGGIQVRDHQGVERVRSLLQSMGEERGERSSGLDRDLDGRLAEVLEIISQCGLKKIRDGGRLSGGSGQNGQGAPGLGRGEALQHGVRQFRVLLQREGGVRLG